jgi:hypothetical protein
MTDKETARLNPGRNRQRNWSVRYFVAIAYRFLYPRM